MPAAGVGLSARRRAETNCPSRPVTARGIFTTPARSCWPPKILPRRKKCSKSALAAQDERVQPPALYNLGHTRFAEGVELLKKGPDAQKVSAQGSAALAAGEQAMRQAESALAENNLDKMIAAYLEGRGARHEFARGGKSRGGGDGNLRENVAKMAAGGGRFQGRGGIESRPTPTRRTTRKLSSAASRSSWTVCARCRR